MGVECVDNLIRDKDKGFDSLMMRIQKASISKITLSC